MGVSNTEGEGLSERKRARISAKRSRMTRQAVTGPAQLLGVGAESTVIARRSRRTLPRAGTVMTSRTIDQKAPPMERIERAVPTPPVRAVPGSEAAIQHRAPAAAKPAAASSKQATADNPQPARAAGRSTGLALPGGLHPQDLANLRRTLEITLGGFRKNVIAIAGLVGHENALAISSALAADISQMMGHTTVLVRAEVLSGSRGLASGDRQSQWKVHLQQSQFNIWPAQESEVDLLEPALVNQWLHWLRSSADLTLVGFDTLTRVYDLRDFTRRIDGVIVVNSGQVHDLERMSSAVRILKQEGVRVLGQVRDFSAGP